LSSATPLWSELRVVSRSDVGQVRQRNEDCLAVLADRNWLILSDGMGGYHGGDVASRLAVEAVEARARSLAGPLDDVPGALDTLKKAFAEANDLILRTAAREPQLAGMGATLVTAIFLPNRIVVGHMGDSRLYRLRESTLLRLTRDHTVLQEQVDLGVISRDAARFSPQRGMLTRALGVNTTVQPDFAAYPAWSGDAYLMCSDGLTDMIPDVELLEIVANGLGDLPACADRLVELANSRGGRDNISLILGQLC